MKLTLFTFILFLGSLSVFAATDAPPTFNQMDPIFNSTNFGYEKLNNFRSRAIFESGEKDVLKAYVDNRGHVVVTERNPHGFMKISHLINKNKIPKLACVSNSIDGSALTVNVALFSSDLAGETIFLEYAKMKRGPKAGIGSNDDVPPGAVFNAANSNLLFYYDSKSQKYRETALMGVYAKENRERIGAMPKIWSSTNPSVINAINNFALPNPEGQIDDEIFGRRFYVFKGMSSNGVEMGYGMHVDTIISSEFQSIEISAFPAILSNRVNPTTVGMQCIRLVVGR